MKTPRWISPMEAFTHPNLLKFEKITTYNELLNEEGLLKTKDQLESQGLTFSWWPQLQLQSIYNQDKKTQGFYREYTTLDKILLTIEKKQIQKVHKFLLQWDTQDEEVKETIVKWSKNFGYRA